MSEQILKDVERLLSVPPSMLRVELGVSGITCVRVKNRIKRLKKAILNWEKSPNEDTKERLEKEIRSINRYKNKLNNLKGAPPSLDTVKRETLIYETITNFVFDRFLVLEVLNKNQESVRGIIPEFNKEKSEFKRKNKTKGVYHLASLGRILKEKFGVRQSTKSSCGFHFVNSMVPSKEGKESLYKLHVLLFARFRVPHTLNVKKLYKLYPLDLSCETCKNSHCKFKKCLNHACKECPSSIYVTRGCDCYECHKKKSCKISKSCKNLMLFLRKCAEDFR